MNDLGRRGWVALVMLAGALIGALRLWGEGLWSDPFLPYSDQTFQAILVLRQMDPALFADDVLVEAIDGFWPDTTFRALATWCGWFGSLESGWAAAAAVCAALLAGGVYRLGRELASPAVGLLAALSSVCVVRIGAAGEWGLVPWIPRLMTMALAPWLLHALWFTTGVRARALLGLGAGLSLLLHSLSGLQLGVLIGALALIGPVRFDVREWCGYTAGAVAGALPALLLFPSGDSLLDPAPKEDLVRTCFAYYVDLPLYQVVRLTVQVVVLAGVGLGAHALTRATANGGRSSGSEDSGAGGSRVFALGWVAAILALTHVLLVVYDTALALSTARWFKYTFLALLLGASMAVVRLFAQGGMRGLAGLALATMLVLPVDRWVFERTWSLPGLGAAMERSRGRLPKVFRSDYAEPRDELRKLAKDIAARVPENAVLLVPPRGASVIRLHSRRSLFVTGGDSVIALYDRAAFTEFESRMARCLDAYAEGWPQVRALGRESGCDYALVPSRWREGGVLPNAAVSIAAWELVAVR